MLKVGITGGIGSGKTTVARVFHLLGIPVYSADDAARSLLDEDAAIHEGLKKLFGTDAFGTDGKPDRKRIAEAVFTDKSKLEKLNALVHPRVREHFTDWVSSQRSPYILKEAAILFESGTYKELDKIITVTAPVETRMLRVMKRDNASADEVSKRMKSQMSDEEKVKHSHYIISNGNDDLVIPQVIAVHEMLMKDLAV